jgi:ATP-dependent Clp protease, protease subunit
VTRPEPPPWPLPTPLPRPVPPVPPIPPHEPSRLFAPPVSGLPLELADRLLARRIVMLTGPLDRDAGSDAVARLLLLDADSADPIELHFSCADGDLDASLVLAATVDLVRAPVTAMLRGAVGGAPVAVVAAADRVVAHPTASIVLREPSTSASGRADELSAAAEQHARQVGGLCSRIAAATGRTPEEVAADLRAGRILDAQQALDYRLVDEIAVPRR